MLVKAGILVCLADVKALTFSDSLPSGANTQRLFSRVPESILALALAILYKGRMGVGMHATPPLSEQRVCNLLLCFSLF